MPGFFDVLIQSTPPFRQALPLTALADFDDPKYDSEDRAKRDNGLYVHGRHLPSKRAAWVRNTANTGYQKYKGQPLRAAG